MMIPPIATLSRYAPPFVKRWIRSNRNMNKVAQKVYSSFIRIGGPTAIIASGPLAGTKLAVSQHTSYSYLRGTYEIDTQRAIDGMLQSGMVCYDLGASIGYMTLLMARRAKHVYAFEPAPHAASEIQKHVAANGLQNVSIVPHPVSDEIKSVRFSLTDNAYGSSITRDAKWSTIELTTVTLDSFAEAHEFPDLIKIDVEDEEFRVLCGAHQVLKRKPLICCELHSVESARGVKAILRSNGYRITTLRGRPFEIPETVVQGELQVLAFPC